MESLYQAFSRGIKPYQKSIRVRVVHVEPIIVYRNNRGDQRQMLIVGIGDETTHAKCVVYNTDTFSRFQLEKSVLLRNVILKQDENTVVVTSSSKVYPTQDVTVDNETREAARNLVRPPPAPVQSNLEEAKRSPVKTKVSIQGKLVQEEAAQEVKVKNENVKVKAIYLADASNKVKVSLWRNNATTTTVSTGDYIKITDVILNTYRNEISFQTTQHSTIEKIHAPIEVVILTVEGAAVEEDYVKLLIKDKDEIQIIKTLVMEACDVLEQDLEEHLINRCNPTFEIS